MISVQAVVPELLITGASATFVCIGLFITVYNPVSEYENKSEIKKLNPEFYR